LMHRVQVRVFLLGFFLRCYGSLQETG